MVRRYAAAPPCIVQPGGQTGYFKFGSTLVREGLVTLLLVESSDLRRAN